MLQRVFAADLDQARLARPPSPGEAVGAGAAPAARGGRVRIGIVCPYYLGRARRGAGAHQGPGRGADRARATRSR